jgi:hypothetical protein
MGRSKWKQVPITSKEAEGMVVRRVIVFSKPECQILVTIADGAEFMYDF